MRNCNKKPFFSIVDAGFAENRMRAAKPFKSLEASLVNGPYKPEQATRFTGGHDFKR